MNRSPGMMLISTLLISALLVVLGMAYVGKRADQLKANFRTQESCRALEMARAGLESVRVKLDKDPEFPPVSQPGQVFSYSEPVYDLDETALLGRYEVTIDGHYLIAPYQLLRVRVLGTVEANGLVTAKRTILGEFDMAKYLRTNHSLPNPHYYDLVNFQDMGSL